ncbi:gene transfer agent family protein [Methylosinus sp. H3A]|uniref:gene transfer agent family protein n=1 Tax=Methylosinus sp. H3A TaxID=2785786 RepID=UPI0018C25DEC|nr:gene transfer agent family protein [Methylosinus sp. H3A]MBG0810587.1 gene transfer agent family protein [Methylosinus sp. H3A]
MVNRKRGDVEAALDGKVYRLCLTLGALAELESGLGASDLVALAERFEGRRLGARDLIRIIGCGLRGGGHEVSDDDVARMTVAGGLGDYVRIAAALLAATFGESEIANPTAPRDASG